LVRIAAFRLCRFACKEIRASLGNKAVELSGTTAPQKVADDIFDY